MSILGTLNNVLPSFIRLRVAPSPKHIRRLEINAYNPIVRLFGYLNKERQAQEKWTHLDVFGQYILERRLLIRSTRRGRI